MRGKRAKLIRRIAREQTVGQPDVVWLDGGKKVTREVKGKPVSMWASRCELASGCTRAVYQRGKALYKRMRKEGASV